jgi:cell wall assembly regulator SMI1
MNPELQEALDTIRGIYNTESKGKAYPTLKPAMDEQLSAFEKKLGEKLPEDVVDYLTRNDIAIAFDSGFFAISFEQIVDTWGQMKQRLDAGLFDEKLKALKQTDKGNWEGDYIKNVWWSDKWVPFAKDSQGNLKCIDLDPGKAGDKGQVVSLYSADGSGPFSSDFASFSSYIIEQSLLYEDGEYEVETSKEGHMHIYIDTFAAGIKKKIAVIRDVYISNAKGEVKYRSLKQATDAEITAFEAELGTSLPDAYRVFLKHNDVAMAFDGGFEAMPLDNVIRSWRIMKEHLDHGVFDDGRIERHEEEDFGNWKGGYVKKVWWSTKWIPFAEDSCGNMKCIDLDPGENGEKGQITAMEIQDGQGPFATNYLSFSSYLEEQVSFYEDHKYEVEESWDGRPLINVDSYM